MPKITRVACTIILFLGFCSAGFADKLTVVPAQEARKENFQVKTRLGWLTDLDEAKREAAKSGRLIFWVHMLGSIDGKT